MVKNKSNQRLAKCSVCTQPVTTVKADDKMVICTKCKKKITSNTYRTRVCTTCRRYEKSKSKHLYKCSICKIKDREQNIIKMVAEIRELKKFKIWSDKEIGRTD